MVAIAKYIRTMKWELCASFGDHEAKGGIFNKTT